MVTTPSRIGEEIERLRYWTVRVDLDKARDNEIPEKLNNISADFIAVVKLVGNATIRLNYPDAPEIELYQGWGSEIRSRFGKKDPLKRVYMTNEAQPGGYVIFRLGGEASFIEKAAGTVFVPGIDDIISLLQGELQVAATGNDLSSLLVSSSTPLAAGATYTSGWVNVDRYGKIVGTVVADQDGSLVIEQSWDGANVDAEETMNPAYTAGEHRGFWTEVVAPYARVKFTNTGTADQTLFRLRMAGRVI